jgi:hypothetical protein
MFTVSGIAPQLGAPEQSTSTKKGIERSIFVEASKATKPEKSKNESRWERPQVRDDATEVAAATGPAISSKSWPKALPAKRNGD